MILLLNIIEAAAKNKIPKKVNPTVIYNETSPRPLVIPPSKPAVAKTAIEE